MTPVANPTPVLTTEQALIQARATGAPVAVTGATTTTDTVTANPTGTLTLTRTLVPVRKQIAGVWKNLDPTLVWASDGGLTTTTTTSTLNLSGGGSGPLATMRGSGRSLALTLPVPLPAPTLTGPTATYPAILPEVDLQVTADPQGGFTEIFIVHTPAAQRLARVRVFSGFLRGLCEYVVQRAAAHTGLRPIP